eukprot:TRINITY_DN6597_c0_g1_i2.p1 TRINITY_DN6597_c0_g1~~TRINITY_DN6597_c0_g1_i2.p1  ORF type:complete len:1203 (+),score=42.84 TRINITY_DN6597_c0_g1_i2:71-3610(+)
MAGGCLCAIVLAGAIAADKEISCPGQTHCTLNCGIENCEDDDVKMLDVKRDNATVVVLCGMNNKCKKAHMYPTQGSPLHGTLHIHCTAKDACQDANIDCQHFQLPGGCYITCDSGGCEDIRFNCDPTRAQCGLKCPTPADCQNAVCDDVFPTVDCSHLTGEPPTPAPTTPTVSPSGSPTGKPSESPSGSPSGAPVLSPSASPLVPTAAPSASPPTLGPARSPSRAPTDRPVQAPSGAPTVVPSASPSAPIVSSPTLAPSYVPTNQPTRTPSADPTAGALPTQPPIAPPTQPPNALPTQPPIAPPTQPPNALPTQPPIAPPTQPPNALPTQPPIALPTQSPTLSPRRAPTSRPTLAPSTVPTVSSPTLSPARPSGSPSRSSRTLDPSQRPSQGPSSPPSAAPTHRPTPLPAAPSPRPTVSPSVGPSTQPSQRPSDSPESPSRSPTPYPSVAPSSGPSLKPSTAPEDPTSSPSGLPSAAPTDHPQHPSQSPSAETEQPSAPPSPAPTFRPSSIPSTAPGKQPTPGPSSIPTMASSSPRASPTRSPQTTPINRPQGAPTRPPASPSGPGVVPSGAPASSEPGVVPTAGPTAGPTPVSIPDHFGSATRLLLNTGGVPAVLLNVGPGVASLSLLVEDKCMEDAHHHGGFEKNELGPLFHPLRFRVGGDVYVGCVIGNMAMCIVFFVAHLVTVHVLRPLLHTFSYDPMRVETALVLPSFYFGVLLMLYQGSAYAAGHLLLRDGHSQPLSRITGVTGVVILLVGFADITWTYVLKRVQDNVVYQEDGAQGWKRFLCGPGEWCSRQHDSPDWHLRFAYFAWLYRPERASRAMLVLFLETAALAVIAAIQKSSTFQCVLAQGGYAVVLLVHGLWCIIHHPYARPRDLTWEGMYTLLTTAGMGIRVLGYLNVSRDGTETYFKVASALLLLAAIVTWLKLTADFFCFAYVQSWPTCGYVGRRELVQAMVDANTNGLDEPLERNVDGDHVLVCTFEDSSASVGAHGESSGHGVDSDVSPTQGYGPLAPAERRASAVSLQAITLTERRASSNADTPKDNSLSPSPGAAQELAAQTPDLDLQRSRRSVFRRSSTVATTPATPAITPLRTPPAASINVGRGTSGAASECGTASSPPRRPLAASTNAGVGRGRQRLSVRQKSKTGRGRAVRPTTPPTGALTSSPPSPPPMAEFTS